MKLLIDTDLVPLVTGPNPIISPVQQPRTVQSIDKTGQKVDPWFGNDSSVQPSSLDLHIGSIYLPQVAKTKRGGTSNPLSSHSLKFGHTAVISTQESLNLPNNIAGFGFPPSHVAFRGLLMINPGHIDPGFEGELRFTVINVGKDDIALEQGELIFTLLLVKLDSDVKRGYRDRQADKQMKGTSQSQFQSQLDRLSLDFLDVESRTEKSAAKAVYAAGFRAPLWTAVITALVLLATSFWGSYVSNWKPVDKLEDKMKRVEEALGLEGPKSKLDQIEILKKEIRDLHAQSTQNSQPTIEHRVAQLEKTVGIDGTKSKLDQIDSLQRKLADLERRLSPATNQNRQ